MRLDGGVAKGLHQESDGKTRDSLPAVATGWRRPKSVLLVRPNRCLSHAHQHTADIAVRDVGWIRRLISREASTHEQENRGRHQEFHFHNFVM